MAWSRPEIIRAARERTDSSSCCHRNNTIQMSSKPCVASEKNDQLNVTTLTKNSEFSSGISKSCFIAGLNWLSTLSFSECNTLFSCPSSGIFREFIETDFLWLCPSKTMGFPMIFSFQRFPTSSHGGDGLHIGFFCGQPLGRRIHGTRPWERHSAPAINFWGFSVRLSPQTLRQNAGGSLESDE